MNLIGLNVEMEREGETCCFSPETCESLRLTREHVPFLLLKDKNVRSDERMTNFNRVRTPVF